ncbi:gamma-glutamyltransferase family protein [Rhizobium ruizarguesonis]|jgi:gamma-glutamyltranspeptidase/glutathione hydrolase|uniref:Gamma-glutamyltransferase family protein n=1 Tax=Rhizobium ruizarguesonis TaxID=2081791 RepID=A0AAE5C2F7_9HYPH|nr:gamma-glutamyltransferase family protein [Rhizobium ruizarguesonis]MBY5850042.1 gamma-glutamyltransferase family protein [Rhizobium leguminosarum]TBY70498.1 gamma-glutamyltransferase family protein [Rhizobium leguminosarum bv. viciae]MBY5885269.1 gamma-glutamyltransferase family protein [Rhizobium leguminosarum]MBY5895724.1 gamma-glutamyltransferase family protein [Rhizobium leguminosarum]MCB2402898.1 gamma-glutamyltransferase family protein [Rhizobium ruizarguesonis]
MTAFTTRPEILGTFGVVTSTHWIASAVGMSILEKGGNAFDAAVATGFVLQIVEPHLCGPGGDLPAVIYSKKKDKVEVICAQGPAPAGATIEHYTAEGLSLIPGDGLLATVIPGSFDGWMLMLRDYGSMSVRDVLEPAIYYAEHGHPMLPRVSATIKGLAALFEKEWPTSYETWLPGGSAPEAHANFRNPVLAETWKRIIAEAEAKSGREAQVEAARDAFYRGFVAEKIDDYLKTAEVMDASGNRHKGVLTANDMANWSATIEEPLTYDYHGWTIAKIGPWGQGPVFLQTLSILKGFELAAMDPAGADFVHTVVEAMKLAFADREVYYGDPNFSEIPIAHLLSETYAAERRKLVGADASFDLRPGIVPGFEAQHDLTMTMLGADSKTGAVYEPTMAHLSEKRGDTVHIDVIDRDGNMVSVTPSGGWLQSSPTVPGLGFCLNSRAQMFWLKSGLPTSLAPGKRPRTTLTPSLGLYEGRPTLAFGTPGGDQQEQWQLSFFLRYAHHKLNLQAAIDQPLFHTSHFPGSFYPRTREPGSLMAEANFGPDVLDALRRKGHKLTVADPWTIGRLTAARRDADGLLRAAATPRLMQAYAIGR